MSGTCNNVAAMLFRVEAAVRLGLTNPACTTTKVKIISFCRDVFGKRGKKSRRLVATEK